MSQMLFTNRNSVRPTILNVEIICNSQSGLNSPIDQLVSTNVRIISLSRDAVSRPQLTPEIFQTAIQEIIKNNLESAMQIIGVTTIEELAYSTDVKGNTLLAHAAEYGDAKPIKILLSKILDPQQLTQIKNNAGKTAILLAAQNGHANAITALLEGVSNRQRLVEQIDAQGNSALHYAASYGHAPAITAILSDGINKQLIAERQNNFGYSALMLAADKGYVEVIASIFSAVNNRQPLAEQINNFGQTVLMNGLLSDTSALVITEILESIEDPEKLIFHVNNEGLNLFTYALMRGNIDAAIVIFDKAKDKTTLLFKKNDPNEEAAIQIMSPEIKDVFTKKFYESKH
jgi:ankyrin repeat protein